MRGMDVIIEGGGCDPAIVARVFPRGMATALHSMDESLNPS